MARIFDLLAPAEATRMAGDDGVAIEDAHGVEAGEQHLRTTDAPLTRHQSQRQDQLYKSLSFIRITLRTILKTPAVKPQNPRITRFYAAVNTCDPE